MAHPWANQREVRYHIWTQANHDLSSLSGPWQPKHRWDASVKGTTAPRSLFPALIVFSSDCILPTALWAALSLFCPLKLNLLGKKKFLFLSLTLAPFSAFLDFPVVVSFIHPSIMEAATLKITTDALFLARLPHPVGPQSSWIFIFLTSPMLAHHYCSSFHFFSHTVPDEHWHLHFIWNGPQPLGPCTLSPDSPSESLPSSSLPDLGWGFRIATGGNPTTLSFDFTILWTLPFEKDSPLFSAPARLAESLVPEVFFRLSHHHTFIHTIPPDKNVFLLSLFSQILPGQLRSHCWNLLKYPRLQRVFSPLKSYMPVDSWTNFLKETLGFNNSASVTLLWLYCQCLIVCHNSRK